MAAGDSEPIWTTWLSAKQSIQKSAGLGYRGVLGLGSGFRFWV